MTPAWCQRYSQWRNGHKTSPNRVQNFQHVHINKWHYHWAPAGINISQLPSVPANGVEPGRHGPPATDPTQRLRVVGLPQWPTGQPIGGGVGWWWRQGDNGDRKHVPVNGIRHTGQHKHEAIWLQSWHVDSGITELYVTNFIGTDWPYINVIVTAIHLWAIGCWPVAYIPMCIYHLTICWWAILQLVIWDRVSTQRAWPHLRH